MLSRLQFYLVVIAPGAVLMALEIVSSRVLAPHFGSSVYVWGSIIGVFLAAMSIGYFWGGRLADRHPRIEGLGRLLLAAAAAQAAVLIGGQRTVEVIGEATQGSPAGTLLATTVLFAPATIFLSMVTPYAVKLAARNLEALGGTAGHLYALSTCGSLAGTLLATFVLIPRLNLDAILLLLLAATLSISTLALLVDWRREKLYLALVGGLLLAILVTPRGGSVDADFKVLADRITPYQTLRVYETGGVRHMESDGNLHAAVDAVTGEPWMAYARQAATALLIAPDLDSLLVLGMGAGSVGLHLRRHLPELEVDFVDIDSAVPELATKLMFFPPDDEQLRVHIDDARRFLQNHRDETWDYIYVDTYIGQSIPFHLSTIEFFQEIKQHLGPNGVFGLNMASSLENSFAQAILRTVNSVFQKVYVFDIRGGNMLFLATDRRDAPAGHKELATVAKQLDARLTSDPPFLEMAGWSRALDLDLTRAMLLTDKFAPVNHLIHLGRADERWLAGERPRDGAAGDQTGAREQP